MVELSEKANLGISAISDMLGSSIADGLEAFAQSDKFGAALSRLALETCYAERWNAEHLSRRERSLMLIATLIALRQPRELTNHLRLGVANGVKVEDLEEILLHLVPYVGFPATSDASAAMRAFINDNYPDK